MSDKLNEYGDGMKLPALHPDRETNLERYLEVLSGRLDLLCSVLKETAEFTLVGDALKHVNWALKETDPANLDEAHPNCG